MELNFSTFVRKPFTVEAVLITEDNIEEVSKFVGELKHKKEDGSPFIQVDRRIVPSVHRVYPGFWMTQMNNNIRCYAPHVFTEQFVESNKTIMEWVEYINKDRDDQKKTPESPDAEVVVES